MSSKRAFSKALILKSQQKADMPIYIYECTNCGTVSKISHSMSEKIEYCDVCESIGTLFRRPSLFYNPKKDTKEKIGSHVNEFIKDAKKDLEQQKEELRNKND